MLIRFSMVLTVSAALAQTELQVLPAQLAVAFGGISGKVILYTDAAIFVDDVLPSYSFAIRRANIKSLETTTTNNTVIVHTLKPVKDREGERNRLALRLADDSAALAFQKWHEADAAATPKDAPPLSQVDMQYDARHKRRFYGSNRGRLIVTAEKMIYESIEDIGRSRQWRYNEIKQLKRDNPYNLRIEPFTGDRYEFELLGKPLDNADFQKLVARITSARALR